MKIDLKNHLMDYLENEFGKNDEVEILAIDDTGFTVRIDGIFDYIIDIRKMNVNPKPPSGFNLKKDRGP
jgi:hypothetical protein